MNLEELKCINCGGNDFQIGDFLICEYCKSAFKVPKELGASCYMPMHGSSGTASYVDGGVASRKYGYDDCETKIIKDSNGNIVNVFREKLGI
jgi:hypothetical protein